MSEARKGFKMSSESVAKSVNSKRKNGAYERIAEVARRNGKLSSKQVRCVETNVIYESIGEAAKATGICRQNISACLKGVSGTAGKRHWELVNLIEVTSWK